MKSTLSASTLSAPSSLPSALVWTYIIAIRGKKEQNSRWRGTKVIADGGERKSQGCGEAEDI